MNKKIWIFFFILLLAAVLRLYQLGIVPPGPNRDEASIGYTAYSLLQTGKDEYGKWLPLSFKSFGDWKLPLYIYVTVSFVKILGLTTFAIRLPSALFGIASVVLTFFLAKKLSQNNIISFLAMFYMCVSPWSIHFSRVGSEANTAVFLTLVAILSFFKGLHKQQYLILSAIFFSLTYFTYAGNYVFTTVLVLGLAYLYKAELLSKKSLVAGVIFVCLSGFIIYQTLSANTTKISGIGIFGDPSVVHAQIEIPRNQYTNPQSFLARLFHNRVSFATERFIQNYLMSFSPEFLFIKGGDNRAHNIANFGNMYLLDVLPLFLGVLYLLYFKKNKEAKFALWWLIISPLAASITKDAPHSARMLAVLPILPYICALGFFYFLSLLKGLNKKLAYIILIGACLAYAYNVGIYLDRYYVQFPKNEADAWGLGYQELSNFFTNTQNKDKQVIMTKPEYSPYIFFLFYQKYNPAQFQKEAVRYPATTDGFFHVKSFNHYTFRDIDWAKDTALPHAILVVDPLSVPIEIKDKFAVSYIMLPNQTPMFAIIETK